MGGDWDEFNDQRRRRLGSSDDFRRWLEREHEELVVPEDEVVLGCGGAGWSPRDEEPPPEGEPCPRCHGNPGTSVSLCAKCGRSPFDALLAEQRRLAKEREDGE